MKIMTMLEAARLVQTCRYDTKEKYAQDIHGVAISPGLLAAWESVEVTLDGVKATVDMTLHGHSMRIDTPAGPLWFGCPPQYPTEPTDGAVYGEPWEYHEGVQDYGYRITTRDGIGITYLQLKRVAECVNACAGCHGDMFLGELLQLRTEAAEMTGLRRALVALPKDASDEECREINEKLTVIVARIMRRRSADSDPTFSAAQEAERKEFEESGCCVLCAKAMIEHERGVISEYILNLPHPGISRGSLGGLAGAILKGVYKKGD